tara:strand:+ start:6332 stop:6883 length:552 start_codon:yes stop_codon:yes gene_type:complete
MNFLSIALALSAIGILLLFQAWKKNHLIGYYDSLIGWALNFLAIYFWSTAVGWEFGSVYAFTVPSIVAIVFVAANREPRSPKKISVTRSGLKAPTPGKLIAFLRTFFLVTVLAGTAGLLSSAAISSLLSKELLNNLVFGVFLMPVLWGAYAYWVSSDPSQARSSLSLLGITVISFIFIRYLNA